MEAFQATARCLGRHDRLLLLQMKVVTRALEDTHRIIRAVGAMKRLLGREGCYVGKKVRGDGSRVRCRDRRR